MTRSVLARAGWGPAAVLRASTAAVDRPTRRGWSAVAAFSSRLVAAVRPWRRARTLALFLGLAAPFAAGAAITDAHGQIEDPVLEARFESITKDLRCLVCQNESIADSNAELASDLRRQVREMLAAGKSDREIFDYMTDRYGEFVRFNTPLEAKTLFIWGAPFVVLGLGVFIVMRVSRQRARLPMDDEPAGGL